MVIEASHMMGYGLNVTFNMLNAICCKQQNGTWLRLSWTALVMEALKMKL